jgi:CHAT domain-containing protein
VVHFAGHAVEDRDFPDRSYLAMPGSERLMPAQIQKSDFRHVRLLILSACSTASGAVERGEGVLSLARPFLAAGVQQVLATVNAVDDDVAPLLVDFHRKIRNGATPAAALRDVQREAYQREGRVSLRGWAAFELFGVAPSR